MRSLFRRPIWLAAAALAAVACGGGEGGAAGGQADLPFSGGGKVAGSDVEEWSLLSVPREGGTVEARAADDPGRVLWTGATELPAARSIHLLEGPLLVLRTPGGTVHRYDPRSDELTRVGEVAPDAEWVARGRHGVFREGGGRLLQVGPDGAWRYELGTTALWAGPAADGAVAALVEGDDGAPSVWLVQRGASEPEARADSVLGEPVLVTAWGRRMAGPGPGGGTVRFVTVPSLSVSGEVALDGPLTALAASPSSHEVYAGVGGGSPRVVRVSRFALEARELADMEREVRALRPAVLGGFVLVHDGGDPLWVPLAGDTARRLESEWRDDLPLGTPDGRVLLAREEGLAIWDPDDGRSEPVEAPAGRWWGAARWNPAPPAVVSGRVEGERVGRGSDTVGPARAGERRGPTRRASPPADSLVPVEQDGPTRTPAAESAPPAAPDSADRGVEPGHYAVVAAARDVGGVRRLLRELVKAGYPTDVQRHRDDAGRLWYRGVVGPYESREEAEAAARQLRRERDVDPWVTEIRAGAGARDVFP